METVARACHELRGPLTAAQARPRPRRRQGELSPARLRAIDLELGRAALVLDDLEAVRTRRARLAGDRGVDLEQLVSDSVEAWRPAAAAKESSCVPRGRVGGDRLGRSAAACASHGQPDLERDRARGRSGRGSWARRRRSAPGSRSPTPGRGCRRRLGSSCVGRGGGGDAGVAASRSRPRSRRPRGAACGGAGGSGRPAGGRVAGGGGADAAPAERRTSRESPAVAWAASAANPGCAATRRDLGATGWPAADPGSPASALRMSPRAAVRARGGPASSDTVPAGVRCQVVQVARATAAGDRGNLLARIAAGSAPPAGAQPPGRHRP